MFIERHDLTQRFGGQLRIHQRCGWTVAFEYAMARLAVQFVAGQPLGGHDGAGLVQGTAFHQCLGLGQAIGDQEVVMLGQICLVRTGGNHEFTRDHAGALVDQLVKRVLSIGAGFAPDNWTRMIGQIRPIH